MLNWILNRIAGDYNKKQLYKIQPIVSKINNFFEEYENLTDEELKQKTFEFKERLKNWETLDGLLPESFAVVKQASKRMVGSQLEVKGSIVNWNMVPYDVQLVGSMILHQWQIAEMKTWEWKTLVAVMAVYLNALEWKWVHIVTVNDYLASRDAQRMGYLYEWLGLSVGCVVKWVPISQRYLEYQKDITYVENSELWFDYLRDNLVKSMQERVLLRRPLNFAIVDEIDSILVDEARTPLIISEAREEATEKYSYYANIIKTLVPCSGQKKVSKWLLHEIMNESKSKNNDEEDWDYYIDEKTKTVSLSSMWIAKLEKILKVDNLYSDIGFEEIHHIENALRANAVYRSDREYIVQNWEVLIVDEHTGRAMPWRRFSDWLHQAIEAKESVQIKRESQTMATITYQNFFKQYKKLAGMTWTALTEAEEFNKIYNLEVLEIPTNKTVIRVDKRDKLYFNQKAKRKFIKDYIKFYHEIWQPILIGTSSIHTSEQISKLLNSESITHSVLNAKFHEQEAQIIANAWKYKSVVVATNMAWRWTDIKLEDGLNLKLAENYAKWIQKMLKEKNSISIVLYSNKEFELTMDWIQKQFSLSEEEMRKAESGTFKSEDFEFTVTFNRGKSDSNDAFAEIIFKDIKSLDSSLLKKDFHYWLFILWTEKHESRRIDNQLRGRAWRQWDPWMSVFFVALDDSIMKKMWWERIQQMAGLLMSSSDLENLELTQKQFTNSIVRAQKQIEWRNFWIRKHLFDYDSVVDKQRQKIYRWRDSIIETELLYDSDEQKKQKQDSFFDETIKDIEINLQQIFIEKVEKAKEIWQSVEDLLETEQKEWFVFFPENFKTMKYEDLKKIIFDFVFQRFMSSINSSDKIQVYNIFKQVTLQNIDKLWVDHIDEMQQLREKVSLMGYAQKDPLVVYKQEAYEKYQLLLSRLKLETTQMLVNIDYSQPQKLSVWEVDESNYLENLKKLASSWELQKFIKSSQKEDSRKIIFEDEDGFEIYDSGDVKIPVEQEVVNLNSKQKVRPNDNCSCWSGKKYKKCCGQNIKN